MSLGMAKGFDMADYILPSSSVDSSAYVHPFAQVKDAAIGARTNVWAFASVIRNAKVGSDCSIATCAIVDGSKVGDRCLIGHSAFLNPGIVIGNDVFIGAHVNLCNDAWPRVEKTYFDMERLISGDFITTRIEDGASIGAGVTVLPGLVIGAGAMIAAGAVVTKSVPAFHLYKRSGEIVLIKPGQTTNRMRLAAA